MTHEVAMRRAQQALAEIPLPPRGRGKVTLELQFNHSGDGSVVLKRRQTIEEEDR